MSLDPSKMKAALVGLAVGDALGTTLEFGPGTPDESHCDLIGGGPFNMPPGGWTDDTSMALCLAESLIEKDGFDAYDLMDRFCRWWKEGYLSHNGRCFDIGFTTRRALYRFTTDGEPFAGDPSPEAAGNGSLMRLSPVSIYFCNDRGKAAEVARDQSKTTHAAPQCLDACAEFSGLLISAFEGNAKVVSHHDPMTVSASGYVVDTLEAAMWAVARTDSFEGALIKAVNLGDDADTVGAVTGQLAGAIYGYEAIPDRWLERLVWREKIEDLAATLVSQAPPPTAAG